MKKLVIRPFMIFNGEYENKQMNREGIVNAGILMEETLFSPQYLHFDKNKSVVIKNGHRTEVLKKLRSFAKKINIENEMLLLYFCGHGCPDYKSGTLYLAMRDMDFDYVTDDGIEVNTINKIIKDYKIKYYAIMLDCCHAGMYSMGIPETGIYSISMNEYSDTKGTFVIPSTDAKNVSYTMNFDGKQYPPFSYYFFNILQKGIANEFNRISFKDIYNEIKKNLKDLDLELPIVDQKGELFSVAIWENLKYRDVYSKSDIQENKEDTLNVLLVKSSIEHPIKFDDFGVPLGLWVLKDYIDKYGMDIYIEIYDERLELQKVGDDKEKKKQVLDKYSDIIKKYDVVGLSMSSSEVCPALKKLKIAKEQGKITTVGGIFTSSNEQYLLETGVVDYVTPGVGTSALRKLLEWLLNQKRIKKSKEKNGEEYRIEKNNEIPGVATSDNLNSFFVPTDIGLSNMSFETWNMIMERYKAFLYDSERKKYKMDIFSARGCRGTCTFCSVQKECGRQITYRLERFVIDEVKNLYMNGFTYISLKDEDCLDNEEHFMNIIKNLQLEGIKFKIRTRVDHLLERRDFLEELRNYGVDEIQYGIESFDYMLLSGISKGIKKKQIDKIKNFIKLNADLHIIANCSFILGLPGETEEYYDELFEFIKEIYDYSKDYKPKVYINFLTPHPHASSFNTAGHYKMVTVDLNYFTHKFPVGFYEQENGMGYAIRVKMIETYEKIIKYTKSEKYNPSLIENEKYEYLSAFQIGNKFILDNPELPNYLEKK